MNETAKTGKGISFILHENGIALQLAQNAPNSSWYVKC